MNLRPLGYEPSELPSCSTPRRCVHNSNHDKRQAQIEPHHTARPASRDRRLPSRLLARCTRPRARSREGSRSPAPDGPPPGAVLPEADGAAAGARSPGHHGAAAWHSSPPATASQPTAAGCAGGRPSPGSVVRITRITRHTNATGPQGRLAPARTPTGPRPRPVRELHRGHPGPSRTGALQRAPGRTGPGDSVGMDQPEPSRPRALPEPRGTSSRRPPPGPRGTRARRRHRSRPPQPGTEAADEAPAAPRTRAPGDARAGSGAGPPGPSGPASQESPPAPQGGGLAGARAPAEATRGALVRGHHQGNAGPLAQSATRAARSRLEREGCHQRGRTARCTTKAAWTPRTRRHQSRSHPRPPHPPGPRHRVQPVQGHHQGRPEAPRATVPPGVSPRFPPDTRRGPHGVPGRRGAPTPTAPHAGRRGASRHVRPPPPGPVPPRGRTRTVPPPVRRGGR